MLNYRGVTKQPEPGGQGGKRADPAVADRCPDWVWLGPDPPQDGPGRDVEHLGCGDSRGRDRRAAAVGHAGQALTGDAVRRAEPARRFKTDFAQAGRNASPGGRPPGSPRYAPGAPGDG